MRNYLMLLWHMHQPFYKDLAEGVYTMPWVRLHALKDYYGMVAMLRDFPSVHMTFNLVPALVAQLDEYARDEAKEEEFRIAFKPAQQLSSEERDTLLAFAFQANRENLVNRYPRFRELYSKAHVEAQGAPAACLFTTQDLLDLQVLSQVAWFDEIYLAGDAEIKRLVEKERGYSEEDKISLRAKEIEIFKVTLEEYKQAESRGQIELSTSPFFHAILPLVCNTRIAEESRPGIRLPRRAFVHPEDARDQLRAAIALHEKFFGHRPRGLWPSEGSVSDEVLRLAAAEGFAWTATDEGVLGRTLQMGFHRQPDGTLWDGKELYRPHQFAAGERNISLFFRDHELSDLIGFVYSRMDPDAAAADLHHRIRAAARSTGDRPAVISIILDGENAWEFFPQNGREFLKKFYARVASDPELQAVTASEALALTEQGTLTHVVPGSWINANFDVWIGAEEDNRAWDLLANARDAFAQNSVAPVVSAAQVKLAQEELWIAEGSDWNWWYGPEHSTPNDKEFDRLYRKHLGNMYRMLGGSPPDELASPIKLTRPHDTSVPPMGLLEPHMDGRVTTYFEWLGAGVYSPDRASGSMHGAAECMERLYYGYSGKALYLRLDFNQDFLSGHDEFEVRFSVRDQVPLHLHVLVAGGKVGALQFWNGEGHADGHRDAAENSRNEPSLPVNGLRAAFSQILEVELSYDLLRAKALSCVQVQVSLWVDDLPLQVIPQEGWLKIELAEDFDGWTEGGGK